MLRPPALCDFIYRSAIGFASLLIALPLSASAQHASVSTWDAANFRIWGYIPYWSGQAGTSVVDQLNAMSAAGTYNHVSDVIYFGGPRPTATGGISYHSTATQSLNTLKNLSAQHGFDLHLSMFDVSGGTVDDVWTSIVSNPTYRQNFVNNVTNILQTYDMDGFNFDWERPNTVAKWGNYTQLARELGDVIRPQGMEISVCDYGSTSSLWDDSPLFDARVYDQLFIMGYHYNATNNNSFANGKLNLDDQGAEKAFTDEQLTIGIGTYGKGVDPDGIEGPATAPGTVTQRTFSEAIANLAYNAVSVTGTFTNVNGVNQTGTWNIESREQVRAKTKLALDRNMPGTFSWTLHYDARNNLGLHRVMHHYTVFYRGIPDLNLDGKVNAADANTLADNMGTVPGWTGTNTAARFDDFYLSGNWEEGDRDGNGFVNQADADWLASRFTTFGVNIPDRLAFTGEFENFADSRGLSGRWNAKRESGGNLRETGNYTQHGPGGLTWTGTGVGAAIHSTSAVTIRNQNAAEAFDSLNTAPRNMSVDLTSPIDTSSDKATYVTFLVRQNTSGLSASQLASNSRLLSLDFLDAGGVNQFDFEFRGAQHEFAIESQADAAGQDVAAGGFADNATYLFVGKIAGNGAAANTLQASIFQVASNVGNFASDDFEWTLTAEGGVGFNPTITQLQFTSLYEGSFTVSNVWVGTSADFFALPSAAAGDFNADGFVDTSDYLVWRKSMGQAGHQLAADADGNGRVDDEDYDAWTANFGHVVGGGSGGSANVPEPAAVVSALLAIFTIAGLAARHRRSRLAA
jgi:GH18 family chitinase